jgi:hypothetical protein
MPEVWFNHHGRRFLLEALKQRIRERDIVDVGASVWTALAILSGYTNRRVLSYELIPAAAADTRTVASHLPTWETPCV